MKPGFQLSRYGVELAAAVETRADAISSSEEGQIAANAAALIRSDARIIREVRACHDAHDVVDALKRHFDLLAKYAESQRGIPELADELEELVDEIKAAAGKPWTATGIVNEHTLAGDLLEAARDLLAPLFEGEEAAGCAAAILHEIIEDAIERLRGQAALEELRPALLAGALALKRDWRRYSIPRYIAEGVHFFIEHACTLAF